MKIYIVTVTFNSIKTIGSAIDSVNTQSYGNYEHIIIDGGSTDGTVDFLKAHHHSFSHLISERDDGIYDALNKGFALASGEVLGVMHSDDFFSSNEIFDLVANIFSDTSVDVAYGDLNYVSGKNPNRVIRRWRAGIFSHSRLAWGWMPPHPALFIRRSLFDRLGGFNLQYKISADYDFLIRLFLNHELKAVYIPSVVCFMRLGGESNGSLRKILKKSFEDFLIIRRNNIGGIFTLLSKNIRKIPQFFFKGT
jgi:glycosyltransferase